MNIWTALFLVVSVVILASPILFPSDTVKSRTRKAEDVGRPGDDDLKLDLASGRLDMEDFEAMTGLKAAGPVPGGAGQEGGDDGFVPEG